MKKAKHPKQGERRKKVRNKAKRKVNELKPGESGIVHIALANAQHQVNQKPVATARMAEEKSKKSSRHVGLQAGVSAIAETARIANLLEAGNLRVRREPDGTIIPDDQDYLDVEREYPEKSTAMKNQLAQACALLRALRQYDTGQARAR